MCMHGVNAPLCRILGVDLHRKGSPPKPANQSQGVNALACLCLPPTPSHPLSVQIPGDFQNCSRESSPILNLSGAELRLLFDSFFPDTDPKAHTTLLEVPFPGCYLRNLGTEVLRGTPSAFSPDASTPQPHGRTPCSNVCKVNLPNTRV